MDITQDGVTVTNTATLIGTPAVTISGDDVTFINQGTITDNNDPAHNSGALIVITGDGVTIVNEAGALIRDYRSPWESIRGSAFADTVLARGTIWGDLRLNGGNDLVVQTGIIAARIYFDAGDDEYRLTANAQNVTSQHAPDLFMDLGDDEVTIDMAGVTSFNLREIIGGFGTDSFALSGLAGGSGIINHLDGFEQVEFAGDGAATQLYVGQAGRLGSIIVGAGITLTLGGSLSGDSPNGVVQLGGGGGLDLRRNTTLASIAGSDGADYVKIQGALYGSVALAGAADTLINDGSIGGNVSLGSGDDVYRAIGYYEIFGRDLVAYYDGGTVEGTVDGGAGTDQLHLAARDGRTIDLSRYTGFETLHIESIDFTDLRLTNVQSVPALKVDYNNVELAIGETDAPALLVTLGHALEGFVLVVESTATIGGIVHSSAPGSPIGNADYNIAVTNEGSILGDVELFDGHDHYDGRLGTQSGTVLGFAGDDTILLGAGNDRAEGHHGADLIEGNGGNDELLGGYGGDRLYGGAGDDVLDGGEDDDKLYGGDGNDRLTISGGLFDELYGEGGDDSLLIERSATSDDPVGAFVLDGGAGNDLIMLSLGFSNESTAAVYAGAGDDIVVIGHVAEAATLSLGDGSDVVDIGRFIEGSRAGAIAVTDFATGAGGDKIDLGEDSEVRAAFINWDGRSDLFETGMLRLIQKGADTVLEGDIHGWDSPTVLITFKNVAAGSFTASNFARFTPFVHASGTDADERFEGGAGNDRLAGGGGSDSLFGFGGADTTDGGPGNDSHFVEDAGDVVIERQSEGQDVVYASAHYRLTPGAHVEVLVARFQSSTAPINLTGNELVNAIYGSVGSNVLDGGGGADVMFGFAGDDFYYTDHVGDLVIEAAGEGHDVVYADADFVLTAGSHVEVLLARFQSSTAPINLTGNELNNAIYGSVGANSLTGGGGVDVMFGFAGDDFYFTDNAGDLAIEAANEGHDVVFATADFTLTGGSHVEVLLAQFQSSSAPINLTGNELNNAIYGSVGANALSGGGGGDILFGFAGDDSYFVDSMSDVVVEAASEGHDIVYASASHALTAGSHVEILLAQFQSSSAAIDLAGNELNNAIYGSVGANTLSGRGGIDVLFGYGGADRFLFDTAPGAGNHDYIADFEAGVDRIVLDNAVFTALADGALASGAFHTGSAAASADHRLIYDSADGELFYDADGSGAGAAILIAVLQTGLPLQASDFAVI